MSSIYWNSRLVTTGTRIAAHRVAKGLSLRECASRSGMHTSTLHRIEHGTQEARADELERLASTLTCAVGDFFAKKRRGRAA